MSELPNGYRRGWYSAEDLAVFRIAEGALKAAEEQHAEVCAGISRRWAAIHSTIGPPESVYEASVRDATVAGMKPAGIGWGMIAEPGRGIMVVAIVSVGTADYAWVPDMSTPWPAAASIKASRYRAPNGSRVEPTVVLPAFWDQGEALRYSPGSVCLFAAIWLKGTLAPRLTLRASGEELPFIALEELQAVRRLGDAERLLKHLRFLERLAASGRPPGFRPDWRGAAKESFELERQTPKPTIKAIAKRLNTSEASLYRWRAALLDEGYTPNS